MKRKFTLLLAMIATIFSISAQITNAVSWTANHKLTSKNEGVITFTAKIAPSYLMYSMDIIEDGPTPLSFTWDKLQGVKLKGKPTPNVAAHKQHDDVYGQALSWWTGSVTLTQAFVVTEPNYFIDCSVEFMACNDKNCLAPTNESFQFKGTLQNSEKDETVAKEDAKTETAIILAHLGR